MRVSSRGAVGAAKASVHARMTGEFCLRFTPLARGIRFPLGLRQVLQTASRLLAKYRVPTIQLELTRTPGAKNQTSPPPPPPPRPRRRRSPQLFIALLLTPGALLHYCTTALLHDCTTALLHHCTTALLHYCTTALLHYCATALLHHCTTALLHYCTTALLHHCTTALLYYCTTALLTYFVSRPAPPYLSLSRPFSSYSICFFLN